MRELASVDAGKPDFVDRARIALDNSVSTVRDVFGHNSDEAFQVNSALLEDSAVTRGFFDEEDGGVAEAVRQQAAIRRVLPRLENLAGIVDEKTVAAPVRAAATQEPSAAPATSRRVFVVHGHDEAVKQEVARILERLDLEPIILHEWPDQGRTIIEKLEAHTDVAYAVVLMTPDDRGGSKDVDPGSYQLRARQNVLVELGVFLGKIGRSRVTVLHAPEVEMPSDYTGVLFKKLDPAGAWVLELAKEIKAAGIPVDLNRL